MKQYCLILLLFLLTFFNSFSQPKDNTNNYRVNLNELRMKTYEKDSTANALVLYEYGNSLVNQRNFDIVTEEKYKIKILNQEGFKSANVTILLYNTKSKTEKIDNINAMTYNLVDGEIVKTKLKEENIFREKYNDNYTLIKFAMPNIKKGSVINYGYTITSPFVYKYRGWKFQSDIPKLYSEYNTSIPGNYNYNIWLNGDLKIDIVNERKRERCIEGGGGTYADCFDGTYIMKNIPRFIEESYISSKNNFISRLDYELTSIQGFNGSIKYFNRIDIDLKNSKNFGLQMRKSKTVKNLIDNQSLRNVDDLEKAKIIYNYVKNNYVWNGSYGVVFEDNSIKKIINDKSGNIYEINLLLYNLLKAHKIDCKPLLLSTRDNGLINKKKPKISGLNYLIIHATIFGKKYNLDVSSKHLNFGQISFSCLNQSGRLLDFDKGSKWIDIEPHPPSSTQYEVEVNIDENETIIGKISSKTTGYHALKKRKSYFKNSDSYVNNLEDRYPKAEIFDHEVTRGSKAGPEFIEFYNIKYEGDETEENLYLNPFFVEFFTENPFKHQERTYPIDFGYKDTFYYVLKLNFGDNYSLEEKPKDLSFTLPDNKGLIHFSSAVQENFINLLFKVSFNEAIYSAEYYPYLKEFMSKVVDIQINSLIVLKKK